MLCRLYSFLPAILMIEGTFSHTVSYYSMCSGVFTCCPYWATSIMKELHASRYSANGTSFSSEGCIFYLIFFIYNSLEETLNMGILRQVGTSSSSKIFLLLNLHRKVGRGYNCRNFQRRLGQCLYSIGLYAIL